MDQAWFPYVLFWSIGLLFFAVEWTFPARALRYRSVFLRDLVALGIYNLSFLVVVQATDRVPIPDYLPPAAREMPTVFKLLIFYVVEDFGLYWMHRLVHTTYVWPVHRWHHSPAYLYWMAGMRATIPHILLFNCAYVAALP